MERIVDRALAWAAEGTAGRTALIPAEGAGPGGRPLKAVDWGCGPTPLCAELLRARGVDAVAWDPCFRPEELPAPGSADLVLCVEVAEHFLDPIADFRAFALRLKPGGRALLHTHLAPEEDGAFLRWWYIEDPTHVSFYSKQSLELLAEHAALERPRTEEGKFCLLRRPLPVLVAGGANLDIEGRPAAGLVARDSNPGTVALSPGGAGRNVAENLAALGLAVELVTAVGADAAGRDLIERTAARGVGTSGAVVVEGHGTSMYLSILDGEGDMALAVSGMGIYDAFGPAEALAGAERAAAAACAVSCGADADSPFSALVLDGNLLPEAAEALLDRFPGIPAWLDPVSTAKARRTAAYRGGALLGRLACTKPNLAEAEAMAEAEAEGGGAEDGAADAVTGAAEAAGTSAGAAAASRAADARERALRAAAALRARGVGTVMVSLGAEGLCAADGGGAWAVRPPAQEPVSATGAGDAALAGSLRAALLGRGAAEQALRGCAAAAITLQDARAVSPDLDGYSLLSLALRWEREGAASIETCTIEEYDHEER